MDLGGAIGAGCFFSDTACMRTMLIKRARLLATG
jgi:hypothetical protein